MSQQIAVVAGGSLGLGREVARGLLASGRKVAILGRSQQSLDEAAADLGGSVLAVPVDIGQEASVAAGFARIDAALGPVDTLVNCAAIFQPFALEDATAERIMPMVEINFCGIVYCMREAVSRMRGLGGGDIVNVSSESVHTTTPFFTIYTATKAAVESFTRTMGEELREDGIRCTTFRVGRMLSHGANNVAMEPALMERYLDRIQVTGSGYRTGEGMSTQSAAQALVGLLQIPRDARAEFMEVRSR